MKYYTYEFGLKGKLQLIRLEILVEGLFEYFVKEHHDDCFGGFTWNKKLCKDLVWACEHNQEKELLERIRLEVLGSWRVGDLAYLCNKNVYGMIAKVNRVTLLIDNPEWLKPKYCMKQNVILVSKAT